MPNDTWRIRLEVALTLMVMECDCLQNPNFNQESPLTIQQCPVRFLKYVFPLLRSELLDEEIRDMKYSEVVSMYEEVDFYGLEDARLKLLQLYPALGQSFPQFHQLYTYRSERSDRLNCALLFRTCGVVYRWRLENEKPIFECGGRSEPELRSPSSSQYT